MDDDVLRMDEAVDRSCRMSSVKICLTHNMTPMSLSVRLSVPVALAVVVLTGCSEKAPEGQRVEIVAGGGSGGSGARALDARIGGSLRDLDVGADGAVRLLTDEGGHVAIWRVQADGGLKKISVASAVKSAEQLAVAKDGTAYVTSDAGLWKVGDDGAATRVVGDGKSGFTADGDAATGSSGKVEGVAVDSRGRVVYTEGLAQGQRLLSMVRRVEPDGTVSTIAGTNASSLTSDDDLTKALRLAADPPQGAKARDLALPGGYYTVLAGGDDGTIYVNGKESVLAISPDGSVRALVAGRDPKAVKTAERPFADEGKAVDAATPLYGPAVPPNLSVDAGKVVITSWVIGQRPPAGYRWTGDFTKGQASIVNAAFDTESSSSTTSWPRIRLVGTDGTITSAAWAPRAAAVRDGALYLVMGNSQSGLLVAKVKIPS
jgi:hypothetical protein